MAEIPLNQSSVEKLVGFANGFTPIGMRKGVKFTKRMISYSNTLRKVSKVISKYKISKYKHLTILLVLILLIKNAILKPVVIGRCTAKKGVKKAIRESIATPSFPF